MQVNKNQFSTPSKNQKSSNDGTLNQISFERSPLTTQSLIVKSPSLQQLLPQLTQQRMPSKSFKQNTDGQEIDISSPDYFKMKLNKQNDKLKVELLQQYSEQLIHEINKFKQCIEKKSNTQDYCQYINQKMTIEKGGYYQICFEGKNNFQQSFWVFKFIYNNYPNEPPTIQFDPLIQHHNIIPGTGKFCLLSNSVIPNTQNWKNYQYSSMQTIISNVIEQFLTNPDEAEYPVDHAILDLYLTDQQAYMDYIKKLKRIALEIFEKLMLNR